MICAQCEGKMKCIYSVPIGRSSRYRVYKCLCGQLEETFEVGVDKVVSEENKAALKKAREGRYKIMLFLRRKRV